MIEKEILKHWGFNEEVIIEKENINYETNREEHIWTVNREYLLKASMNEDEVINNINLAKLLNEANIPTQKVIDTINGQSYLKEDEKYYSLFKKIEGTVLKDYFEGDFKSRGFYIGKALGELHNGLSKISEEIKEKINLWDNNLITEINGWVKIELDKYINKCALDEKELKIFEACRREVESDFQETYYKLGRQVIHRDFHGENIIFKDDKVVGFIDFDLSQINSRVFDLCYLCTGSLATIFDKVEMRDKWIKFAKAVINGYESINKLTNNEVNAMKYMMYAIEMIMIAYFAKEGYDDIANNNIRMVNYLNDLWKNNEWGEENG